MTKVDIPLTLIKSAAVGGIAMVWVNFTVKAFKMAGHIISTSPEEETFEPVTKEIVMCEKCQEHFIDIGEELEFGKYDEEIEEVRSWLEDCEEKIMN